MPWGRRVQRQWLLFRARLSGDTEPSGLAMQPVHGPEILEKVAALPVSTWSYRWEPQVRHLGPMAQDFAATFGLGDDDRTINLIDANGVTLVALQALYRRVVALEAEVETLRAPGVDPDHGEHPESGPKHPTFD